MWDYFFFLIIQFKLDCTLYLVLSIKRIVVGVFSPVFILFSKKKFNTKAQKVFFKGIYMHLKLFKDYVVRVTASVS